MREWNLLGEPNLRTLAYLRAFQDLSIQLSNVILLEPGESSTTTTWAQVRELASQVSQVVSQVPVGNPNQVEVVSLLERLPRSTIMYSGPAGAILRDSVLSTGLQFLHVHPGALPEYRGSTTLYYELLTKSRITCSLIELDSGIDTGRVLFQKEFPAPTRREILAPSFDAGLRADTLASYLANEASGHARYPDQDCETPPFYVIHPVLKHLVINRCPGAVD